MLRRRAFVVDQTPPLCWALFHAVWATLGRTRLLWERIRALCDDDARVSMRPRREALWSGLQKFPPLLASASSASGSRVPLGRPALTPGAHPSIVGERRRHGELSGFQQDIRSLLIVTISPQATTRMVETLNALSAAIDHLDVTCHKRELLG